MQSTLTLTYAGTARDQVPLELLRLEQEEWDVNTGAITKGELLRYMSAQIIAALYNAELDCGIDSSGRVQTRLYAYPYVAGLRYRLYLSWGEVSAPKKEMLTITELVQFRLETEATADYPVREILSAVWEDECYGTEGEVVPPPDLSLEVDRLLCASPVYGTARVRYRCERHTYELRIPRRDGAVDNHFSAVAVAVYDGGLVWIEIDPPPRIAKFEADADAECGRTINADVTDDEDDPSPVQPSLRDRRTIVDYCSREIISESFE